VIAPPGASNQTTPLHVALAQAALDAARVGFHHQDGRAGQHAGQGLGAAHTAYTAQPDGDDEAASQGAAA